MFELDSDPPLYLFILFRTLSVTEMSVKLSQDKKNDVYWCQKSRGE